jgi:hypothetical protein
MNFTYSQANQWRALKSYVVERVYVNFKSEEGQIGHVEY